MTIYVLSYFFDWFSQIFCKRKVYIDITELSIN